MFKTPVTTDVRHHPVWKINGCVGTVSALQRFVWKPVLTDTNWQPPQPCFGSQGLKGFAACRRTQPAVAHPLFFFPQGGPAWRSHKGGEFVASRLNETSSLCVKTNRRHHSGRERTKFQV